MSNKLLIFTSSLIATSGISGLGIMIYQDLLSGPIKSRRSTIRKMQKTTTSSINKSSILSRPNLKNAGSEPTITLIPKASSSINSKDKDGFISFSTEDEHEDLEEDEDYSEDDEEIDETIDV